MHQWVDTGIWPQDRVLYPGHCIAINQGAKNWSSPGEIQTSSLTIHNYFSSSRVFELKAVLNERMKPTISCRFKIKMIGNSNTWPVWKCVLQWLASVPSQKSFFDLISKRSKNTSAFWCPVVITLRYYPNIPKLWIHSFWGITYHEWCFIPDPKPTPTHSIPEFLTVLKSSVFTSPVLDRAFLQWHQPPSQWQ